MCREFQACFDTKNSQFPHFFVDQQPPLKSYIIWKYARAESNNVIGTSFIELQSRKVSNARDSQGLITVYAIQATCSYCTELSGFVL